MSDYSKYQAYLRDEKPIAITNTSGLNTYVVACACGGVMEHPEIFYEDYQYIKADTAEEAVQKYNEINNCVYYRGTLMWAMTPEIRPMIPKECVITYEHYPTQSVRVGKRARVCYTADSIPQYHYGVIVRDDIAEPYKTVIKLDNGRYVCGDECAYKTVRPGEIEKEMDNETPIKYKGRAIKVETNTKK